MNWEETSISIEADPIELRAIRSLLRAAPLITVEETTRWWWFGLKRLKITGPTWKLQELQQRIERILDAAWWDRQ